jgi:hypothetical protein
LPEILNKFVPHWMTSGCAHSFLGPLAQSRVESAYFVVARREERLCSLLLSTAERDFPTLAAPFRRD